MFSYDGISFFQGSQSLFLYPLTQSDEFGSGPSHSNLVLFDLHFLFCFVFNDLHLDVLPHDVFMLRLSLSLIHIKTDNRCTHCSLDISHNLFLIRLNLSFQRCRLKIHGRMLMRTVECY